MKHRRSAFTLLEILVVIGIILVLVGMAVIGFNQLDRNANGKSTRVTLGNLQSLLTEFDAETGGIDSLGTNGPTPFPYPGGVYYPVPGPPAQSGPLGYVATGTAIGVTDVNPGTTDRTGTAVKNTWYVLAALMKLPKNRDMILKLPPKQFLLDSSGNPYVPGGAPAGVQGAVLVDGWKNPIIFVPSTGIMVWVTGQSAPFLIKSKDGRPFFASAGPDGDFSADNASTLPSGRSPKADDNLYSFENQ